jgi:hypothetical protein
MSAMLERAHKALQEPEVLEMLERLSHYGLGIYMPHMHTATEDFVPLPSEVLQVERNCQVSFEPRSEVSEGNITAVGWVWDNQASVAAICAVCIPRRLSEGHMVVYKNH